MHYLKLKFLPIVLIMLIFHQLGAARNCCAIDSRFELDPSQVSKSSGRSVGSDKKKRQSGFKKSGQAHKAAVHLQKHADQNQPVPASHEETRTGPNLQQVRAFWDLMVPSKDEAVQPLVFKSDTFELAVDHGRYPLFRALDGGKLLMDAGGTLPPLVRTLLQEKDPSLRIVTSSPADARHLLGTLLSAGGFYSVEEQPVMTFGVDPVLRVRSDFKVERTAESVMRNEVMLVSAARQGFPARLTDYIKKQGFNLLEPFADRNAAPVPLRHQVVHVTPRNQLHAVDQLLETLSVPAERGRRVELFSAAESGIALSVAAERFFERSGKKYVVASFTGDPVTYTLFRLLETKGYRVVMLEPKDTFRSIATKLLGRMELPSSYARHLLVADPGGRYSIEMSGFLLENSSGSGGAVMVTDRPLEKSIRDLLYDHGYLVQERQE